MKQTRQLIVSLDIALLGVGVMKACVGLVCALAIGAWLHAWMAAVFVLAALVLVRSMYWPSLLALIGAAYADWPARQWLGVELSEYVTVQALVAVPLWFVVMEYPDRLEGRAKLAAGACCMTALVSGLAAPWLDGAYWLTAAPLSLAAVVVLVVRMVRHRVPFTTRGWVCCAAIAPMAATTTIQVLVPSTVPFFLSTAAHFNAWLSLGPLALIVLHIGGKRHDRKGGTRVPGVGVDGDVRGGRTEHDVRTRRERVVHDLLSAFGQATRSGPASVPGSEAGLSAEAAVHGKVHLWRDGRDRGATRRSTQDDDRGHGRHDLLRPTTTEVDPDDFAPAPLPLVKGAR